MKRISLMALVATFCVAGSLWACDKEGKIAKVSGKTPPCCQKQLDSAVTKVINALPQMTYRVGTFETCCSKTAAAKAGADGKVQFVVAAKPYDSETEASIALADLLEKEIKTLKTVQFAAGGKAYGCPLSAKAAVKSGQQLQYRLAGFDFATKEQADLALKVINCKLAGCEKDCLSGCLKGVRQAGAKSGCNKGLVGSKTVAAVQKPCCAKDKAAKAATVASKSSPCSKAPKAATVASKASPCGKAAKAATVASKDSPYSKGAKAATVASKASPCGKAAKAATVASKSSPCGKAAKAATVASKASPCGKAAKAATVASKASPCGKAAKAATVASKDSPCSKSAKAVTVAAQSKGGCCKKAQQRLVTAQDQIQTIVKAAATVALTS